MKVGLCVVFSVVLLSSNPLKSVLSERINCKMVPFETEDGAYGTCCIIYKNPPKRNDSDPRGEIAKQIVSMRDLKDGSGTMETSTRQNTDDRIVFDQKKEQQHPQPPPPPNKTIKIENKNVFDSPAICPDGTRRDHADTCTEPF